MSNRVTWYVGSTVVAALLAFCGVAVLAPHASPAATSAILTLSVLAIAAEVLGYELSAGARGSITFIPYLAALLLSPSALCILAFAGVVLVTHSARRVAAAKIAFNVTQLSLAGSLATMVYLVMGGTSMLESPSVITGGVPLAQLPAVAALVVVFMTTNSLSVYGIIAISERKPIVASWKDAMKRTFAYDLFFSPVVYFVAWIDLKWGTWGVVAITAPLLVIRQLYKTNYQLERVNRELLELMVKAIEARDPYTSGHSRRVAQYSRIIARAVGVGPSELEEIEIAALLHDVGKIHEIYAPILRKPEKLSPAEWSVMQTHPIKSAELVSTVSHLKEVIAPIRHHHENWDGTGYPDGLQGTQIPLAARIVLFADTIDAMTTDRPYRKALTERQVRSELIKFRGKQFDPEMCDKLLASPMFGLLFSPNQREKTPEEVTLQSKSSPDLVAVRQL